MQDEFGSSGEGGASGTSADEEAHETSWVHAQEQAQRELERKRKEDQERINREHAAYVEEELERIKADSLYFTDTVKIMGLRSKSDPERILAAQNWGPGPEVSVRLRLGGVCLTFCTSFLFFRLNSRCSWTAATRMPSSRASCCAGLRVFSGAGQSAWCAERV
jgi:hypothetical protein